MTKKVLGRGLDALITTPQTSKHKEYVDYISVDRIKPNKYQPREDFNRQKLNELISSVKEKGVVQPVLIRPSGDGYELIAGERRLKAVKALGYNEIPAVIKDVDDINALELSLIENIQREELNPIEEAHAYKRLTDEFNFTQDMIGQAVGKDRATIANSVRLLALPKKVQDYVSKGELSAGHAKALLSVAGADMQIALSKKAVKRGLSVRALEEMINKKRTVKRTALSVDNETRYIAERLQETLGTKVRILRKKRGGTIQIEYYSNEDLQRLLKMLSCGKIG